MNVGIELIFSAQTSPRKYKNCITYESMKPGYTADLLMANF